MFSRMEMKTVYICLQLAILKLIQKFECITAEYHLSCQLQDIRLFCFQYLLFDCSHPRHNTIDFQMAILQSLSTSKFVDHTHSNCINYGYSSSRKQYNFIHIVPFRISLSFQQLNSHTFLRSKNRY